MDIREQVALETTHLNNGESTRIRCPKCKSPEISMSVWCDNNIIHYKCFRATCGNTYGVLGGVRREPSRKVNQFVPKHLTEPTEPLTTQLKQWLVRKYEISVRKSDGFLYLPETHRLYMPVYNYLGGTIGGLAKQLTVGVKPKTVLYRHQDVPMLHFRRRRPNEVADNGPVVVVEDILSATKLRDIVDSVAILGTHITAPMAAILSNLNRPIILMLDPDAVGKSVGIAKTHRALFNSRVVVPPKDPKDTPYNILGDLIYG